MWSYAKLSQTAAAKGGPDPFVRELVTRGIKMGEKRARRKYGPLYVGLGLLGGFAIDRLIDFAIDRFTRGNDEEAVVNSAAAQMLIDSIPTSSLFPNSLVKRLTRESDSLLSKLPMSSLKSRSTAGTAASPLAMRSHTAGFDTPSILYQTARGGTK